ncbi:MAG: PKD domain-containing protein [Candidatus Zixiibacteriota bacterium]
MIRRKIPLTILAALTGALFFTVSVSAQLPGGAATASADWCGTQKVFEEKYKARFGAAASPEACDQYGLCDDPTERDGWIPTGGPTQYVRMIVHVVALDDGSNPFSTPEHVAGQVAELNNNFAPAGIQFIYQLNQINSTAWRSLSEAEIDGMKSATAIQPDKYLNVWVTVVEFSYSFGTFPWSFDALQATGGIVMGHFHWIDLPNRVFAHEVGHTLGLWHTFHGVDEVTFCGPCYEPPESASSLIGDLCGDSPPTPTNQGPCVNFAGNDACSGLPWGYTMPENYMGYASQTCLTAFTPHQQGRLRCWSNTALDSWVIPFQIAPSVALGATPLTVDFVATTHKDPIAWSWDFGDGGGASVQSPSHTYSNPGLHSVTVDMQTSSSSYELVFPDLIGIQADTLDILTGRVENNRASVQVSVRNYLPLRQIRLPFTYTGPVELRFDSASTAGLRSSHMTDRVSSLVESQDKATIVIDAGTGAPLDPGVGPVVEIFFTVESGSGSGSVPIEVTSYSGYQLTFTCSVGDYVPVSFDGYITSNCCEGIVGDANGDGQYEPTIGDVTMLITHLFVSGIPLDCYLEADVNQSGGLEASSLDLTIGDITELIDYLFITNDPVSECL